MKRLEIKKEIITQAKKLKQLNLLPGSSGNLSYRDKNIIYITPSGIDKDELKINDISEIDIEGNLINGIKPSSEYRLHLEIYKKRNDINSIIHTHPPYTIAFSISKLKPDFNLTVEFKIFVKNIVFTKFKEPGSFDLAKEVSKKAIYSNVIVLENHGLVVLSDNIKKGRVITEEVENFFKINFLVLILKKLKK
jgi:L-fuculose-phosphate aldolase